MEQAKNIKKYVCLTCNYNTCVKQTFTNHILSTCHKYIINDGEEDILINSHCFTCEACNFRTVYRRHYEKHIITKKHLRTISINQPEDTSKKIFDCQICKKDFATKSGLWKHKKKCNIVKTKKAEQANKHIEIEPNILLELTLSNKEIQNTLIEQNRFIEQAKEMHEQLNALVGMIETQNDTREDTINITDFVKLFKVYNPEFEETGRLGNIEGMSEFFLKILRENDVDKNRRSIYK